MMTGYDWDVFISHAFEDKESVARPLANHLAGFGLRVWLDESELHLGDSLREKIDTGLAQSRFGLVILSPDFFAKIWTKSELDGLVAKEVGGIKVVLPIWHNLDHDEVRKQSPILAGRLAASTSEGLDNVAAKIILAIENSGSKKRRYAPLFTGLITKKMLLSFPEGTFLLSSSVKPDLAPAFAETIPTHRLRQDFWKRLSNTGLLKTKFYVFEDATTYRAHMTKRKLYAPDDTVELREERPRPSPSDFDIELARAYIAAGKSPPAAWRPLIKCISFDDEKYKFDNLNGLSELAQLERLDLFNIDPTTLKPLAGLKQLKWLYLNCEQAHEIMALSNLTNLEYLDLNASRVKSIDPILTLTQLKHLNIVCPYVNDIYCLSNLTKIEYLSLSTTPIRNIDPLRSLINLQTLDLTATLVEEISALSDLRNLQNLSIFRTSVKNLTALRDLINLRTLDIDETNVEDVSELQNLHNLRFLNARRTKIHDFTKLRHLTNLEILVDGEPYKGNARIDLSEDWQTWYWVRHFGIDKEYLQSMITKHGNFAAELQRKMRWSR